MLANIQLYLKIKYSLVKFYTFSILAKIVPEHSKHNKIINSFLIHCYDRYTKPSVPTVMNIHSSCYWLFQSLQIFWVVERHLCLCVAIWNKARRLVPNNWLRVLRFKASMKNSWEYDNDINKLNACKFDHI